MARANESVAVVPHRSVQLVGLILWRGGLLLAIGASVLEVSRQVLRFVSIPPQLELAGALSSGGMTLVIISLIIERIGDAKAQGSLRD